MCGFAGFVAFSDQRLDVAGRKAVLQRMGRAIAHRGPDDEQFYDDGVLSLVFRRLSIIDLKGGNQPFRNARGNLISVVNGEIYNHQGLRQLFPADHEFATHSDCEVPLHLFEREGVSAMQRLDGMFALLIWDREKQSLVLARDRFGIKPLYVAALPNGLLFGSELKALLAHPDCPRTVDWRALEQPTFLMRSPVPTYIQGIEHLPGGQVMSVDAQGSRRETYWRIEDHLGTAPLGDRAEAYRAAYDEAIEQAIVSHLLSDVPVGLHLSGGIDSSLIAATAAKHRADLSCFTVVERTSFRAGDVESAKRLTSSLGLPWHPVLFDFRTLLDDIQFDLASFEKSVAMMDSPRFNPEWIFKEELHRFSRREHPALRVVLLGQGADEFAGGYSHRIDRPRSHWAQYLDEEVRRGLGQAASVALGMPERFNALARVPHRDGLDPFHQFMPLQINQLQHYNLWHEDRTSMAQSLEARVPFLDHHVVELLASVPASLHSELFWNKSIVRAALQKRVPQFDKNHPKVPFVSTNDQRSILIIVHEMLRRVAPAFIEKYLSRADGPFDAEALRNDLLHTLSRRGAFHEESWRLMECMAIVIFSHQLIADSADGVTQVQARPTGLRTLAAADWPEIESAFSAEPVVDTTQWQLHSRPRLTEDAELLFAAEAGGVQRCVLLHAGRVISEVGLPGSHAWVLKMLRNLGTAQTKDFTVADWAEEFDLPPSLVIQALSVLFQAGFVDAVN